MERLSANQKTGITTVGLRNWGMFFVICSILSRGVLQNRMLGMAGGNTAHLMEMMTNNPDAMGIATLALVLQAVGTCGVPIFCYMLVEGFTHTKDFNKYLIRVLVLAAISEIPYNFAIDGQLLAMSSRNPSFALVLCLVMLHLYQRYPARSLVNAGIKLCVFLAAFVWCEMLGIADGASFVIICTVLWWSKKWPNYRNLIACSASVACMLISPFYLAAPMGFMAIHFYNGEKGTESRALRYAMYPVILLIIGAAAAFMY